MVDRRRRLRTRERFTCGDCGNALHLISRASSPLRRQCLCCSFLDTVHDVRMREALRTVFERHRQGGLSAEPRPNWRFNDQAEATGAASPHLP